MVVSNEKKNEQKGKRVQTTAQTRERACADVMVHPLCYVTPPAVPLNFQMNETHIHPINWPMSCTSQTSSIGVVLSRYSAWKNG